MTFTELYTASLPETKKKLRRTFDIYMRPMYDKIAKEMAFTPEKIIIDKKDGSIHHEKIERD